MFMNFLGDYLVNKKIISPEQLVEAVEYQKTVRLKLGVLAVNSGYMSSEQVSKVHHMQTKADKKFGEIAIQLGFLDETKVQTLLKTQGEAYLFLGQALVDKQFLTLEQFEESLNNYKKDYSLSDESFMAFKNGDIDQIVNLYCDFSKSSLDATYKRYVSLLFRTFVRFVDENFKLIEIKPIERHDFDILATQNIKGEIHFNTCITAELAIYTALGKKFAFTSYNSDIGYAKESVGELLNMINGLYIINLSEDGIDLGLTPQKIFENKSVSEIEDGYCVTIEFLFGRIDFFISKTNPTFS